MTIGSISSVINASLVNRFTGLTISSNSSKNIASALNGGSSQPSIYNGLRLGAKTYATAIQGLNALTTFLNLSKDSLDQLGKITDKLIDVTDRASKNATSQDARNDLDLQFRKLGNQFKQILAKTTIGANNYLDKKGISSLFMAIGLDKTASDSIAQVFSKFLVPSTDTRIASPSEEASRPVHIPPSAYLTQSPVISANGTGAGTFQGESGSASQITVGTGTTPQDSLVKDINYDGAADIITANSGGNSVSVITGNGDGTFKANVDYSTPGVSGQHIDTGDINRDGANDILVTGSSQSVILYGNADGTFKAETAVASAVTPTDGKLRDINRDGILDVVQTDSTHNTMSISLGNGDGTFKIASSFSTTISANYFNTADFNGDGSTDIVVTDTTAGSIAILKGNGDGTFKAAISYSAGSSPRLFGTADMNLDSIPDIVVGNDTGVGTASFSVLTGNADGSFRAPVSTAAATGAGINGGYVGDLNGDGQPDVAYYDTAASLMYSVTQASDGTFTVAQTFNVGSAQPTGLNVGDFNNDGTVDMLIRESGSNSANVAIGNAPLNRSGSPRTLDSASTIFDATRDIRTRPNAYLALADLKQLRHQIDENSKALDNAIDVVKENITLARATGFAFLDVSNKLANGDSADVVAAKLQNQIRTNASAALNQLENLDSITVAALTFDGSQFKIAQSK